MTTPGMDDLSAPGLLFLLRDLPPATEQERQLCDLINNVDLSSTVGNKWDGVVAYISHLLQDLDIAEPVAGGAGIGSIASRNQISNRMVQTGVALVDTNIFVIGDAELLRLVVRSLSDAIADVRKRLRNVVLVFRGAGVCRVVRLLGAEPADDGVLDRLRAIAPGVPYNAIALPHTTPQEQRTVEDAAVDPIVAPGKVDEDGLTVDRAWFVTDSGSKQYLNVDGNAYGFNRVTRAGRDQIESGHWLVVYRTNRPDTHDAGMIFGVARVHAVYRRGDERYAIFDRYLALNPPLPDTAIGGNPRSGNQIAITEITPQIVKDILRANGVTHQDQLPVPIMRLGVPDVLEQLGTLHLERTVIEQCVAAIRGGKHLILRGPPGTGKSTLAMAIGRAATAVGLSRTDAVITTGTSDWTSTDTVGGYRLDPTAGVNTLVFQPGFLLESVASDTWLVVDELNRADIDKAIGQFFSVLSGQPAVLPYFDGDGERVSVSIESAGVTVSDGGYVVTDRWRLIATMNERDRDLLFNMSEAFLRRFAIIDVPAPTDPADWRRILQGAAEIPHPQLASLLHQLTQLPSLRLGPAIIIDCANYLTQQITMALQAGTELNVTQALAGALDALVRPQLASLYGEELAVAEGHLSGLLEASASPHATSQTSPEPAGDADPAEHNADTPAGDQD